MRPSSAVGVYSSDGGSALSLSSRLCLVQSALAFALHHSCSAHSQKGTHAVDNCIELYLDATELWTWIFKVQQPNPRYQYQMHISCISHASTSEYVNRKSHG